MSSSWVESHGWLHHGWDKVNQLILFCLFSKLPRLGSTNLFANSCTIIDPVLQIFRLKLHRPLISEPFFSIILPMERPGIWLQENVFFLYLTEGLKWGADAKEESHLVLQISSCLCHARRFSHAPLCIIQRLNVYLMWWWILLNTCWSLKCLHHLSHSTVRMPC